MTQKRFDQGLRLFTAFNIGVAVALWIIVMLGYARPYTCGASSMPTVETVQPELRIT